MLRGVCRVGLTAVIMVTWYDTLLVRFSYIRITSSYENCMVPHKVLLLLVVVRVRVLGFVLLVFLVVVVVVVVVVLLLLLLLLLLFFFFFFFFVFFVCCAASFWHFFLVLSLFCCPLLNFVTIVLIKILRNLKKLVRKP